MSSGPRDLDLIDVLRAEAVGPPGRRRFRLLLENSQARAALWIAKEQLQALGMTIDQLLGQLPAIWSQSTQARKNLPDQSHTIGADREFQVARLAIGYEEDRKLYVLMAYDADTDPSSAATLSCRATRSQLRDLSQEVMGIVAAGRPSCPVCGTPLEKSGKHICPAINGHAGNAIERGR
jgi:uncharacterized repeat protein (TIGR03847 family)